MIFTEIVNAGYFKVFKSDSLTVLVSKEDGDGEAPYEMRIRFYMNGLDVEVSPGYEDEEKRNNTFDQISGETLNPWISEIIGMLNE